ncbi:MAG: site-specific integrase, partial [Thermoguttaceae bacterium]|nr:site-specific integrase [Thermoguttaceae bacterium]
WAHRQGYLAVVPNIDMAKVGGKMKGRPITGEEFDRMIDATPKVRENDPEPWERLLHGLWLSGLRISEAVALDWNDGPFQMDLAGKHPCFRIQGDGQKSGKAELCPCAPDFVEWLLGNTPEGERTGRVFPLPDQRTGEQIGSREAGPVVSSIGAKAGIVVDADTRKTASAHDLRRSFGSRWARKVMPAVLQRLMRHSHISTTMSFYVALDADSIGDDLWAEHGKDSRPHNNSRNICPKSEVADDTNNDANPYTVRSTGGGT